MGAPAVADPTSSVAALAALAVRGKRTARIAAGIAAAQVGREVWTQGRSAWTSRRRYVVSVESTDPVWDDLHDWLAANMNAANRRAVTVVTGQSRGDGPVPDGGGTDRRVVVRFSGRQPQVLRIDGHRVRASVEYDDVPGSVTRRIERVEFEGQSASARDAVIRLIATLSERTAHRDPRVFYSGRWGGWDRAPEVPPRPLDSVVLAEGQMERLFADMGRFLAAERTYVRLGVPWHRGYLFHGDPGTGKTSTARALAAHFGLDLHLLSLGDIEADASLTSLVCGIGKRAMLLVEDIDVAAAAKDRSEGAEPRGASLAGLLNALDGAATPHGLLTVLTTNHPSSLDRALVRPGRCDLVEEFAALQPDRVAALFERMTGTPLPRPPRVPVNAARVAQAVLAHLYDPAAAAAALVGEGDPVRAG